MKTAGSYLAHVSEAVAKALARSSIREVMEHPGAA
jgi:hypothetical protein